LGDLGVGLREKNKMKGGLGFQTWVGILGCYKLIQLAVKNSSWDVVPSESSLVFLPRHLMISGEHSTEVVPPSLSRATKLLCGEASLGIIRAVSHEEGKLGLNNVEPHIDVQ
jgi:hypothetical protein